MLATRLRGGTEVEIPKNTRIGFKVEDPDTGLDNGTSFFYPEDIKIADEFYYDTYSLTDSIDIDWDNWENIIPGMYNEIFDGELKLPSWLTNAIPGLALSCRVTRPDKTTTPVLDYITLPDMSTLSSKIFFCTVYCDDYHDTVKDEYVAAHSDGSYNSIIGLNNPSASN